MISKDVIFEKHRGRIWEQNEEYQLEILGWEEDEEYASDIEEQYENVVDSKDDRETEEKNKENVVDSSINTDTLSKNYETPVEGRIRRIGESQFG